MTKCPLLSLLFFSLSFFSLSYQDDRHNVAVDGDGEGRRSVPSGAVNVVAATLVPALSKRVQLWKEEEKK